MFIYTYVGTVKVATANEQCSGMNIDGTWTFIRFAASFRCICIIFDSISSSVEVLLRHNSYLFDIITLFVTRYARVQSPCGTNLSLALLLSLCRMSTTGGTHVQHSYPTLASRRAGIGRRLPPTPSKPSTLQLKPTNINFPKLNASPTHVSIQKFDKLFIHSFAYVHLFVNDMILLLLSYREGNEHYLHLILSITVTILIRYSLFADAPLNTSQCSLAATSPRSVAGSERYVL